MLSFSVLTPDHRLQTSVSVVVPVWNREGTIERAIRSALEQTQPPLEVIVCDDGSTDGTADILRRLAREDPRVRVISAGRSGGPAAPRNRGLGHAEGEWVAFLDSDDEWLPGKLQVQSSSTRADVGRSEWLETLVMLNLLGWCSVRRPAKLYRLMSAVVRQLGRELGQKSAAWRVRQG